jgi:hypothetical protein
MGNVMEESNDPLIELFRTVEDGLAIAGSQSEPELGLSLDTAEIELNLVTSKNLEGGIEVKALGLNASAKAGSESRHIYKLKLRRTRAPFNLGGGPSAQDLAKTILALAKATQSVSSRAKNFIMDEAVVTVDLSQTKEGGIKVGVGGSGGTGDTYKVTLTFVARKR